jgi:hypothetical protein
LRKLFVGPPADSNTLQLIVFDNGQVVDSPVGDVSIPVFNQTGDVLPMGNGPIEAGTIALEVDPNATGWVQPGDATKTTSFMIQAWLVLQPPYQSGWINLTRVDVPPVAPGDAQPVISIDRNGQARG